MGPCRRWTQMREREMMHAETEPLVAEIKSLRAEIVSLREDIKGRTHRS